jgi:hypothetical protein
MTAHQLENSTVHAQGGGGEGGRRQEMLTAECTILPLKCSRMHTHKHTMTRRHHKAPAGRGWRE